jgi:hypothetical protein
VAARLKIQVNLVLVKLLVATLAQIPVVEAVVEITEMTDLHIKTLDRA